MSGIKKSCGFFTHSFECGFWNERVRLVRHTKMRRRSHRPVAAAFVELEGTWDVLLGQGVAVGTAWNLETGELVVP